MAVVEELALPTSRRSRRRTDRQVEYSTAAAVVRQAVPAGHRDRVDPLNRAWSVLSDTPGCSISLALETALAAKRLAATATVDIVVTGPNSPRPRFG